MKNTKKVIILKSSSSDGLEKQLNDRLEKLTGVDDIKYPTPAIVFDENKEEVFIQYTAMIIISVSFR